MPKNQPFQSLYIYAVGPYLFYCTLNIYAKKSQSVEFNTRSRIIINGFKMHAVGLSCTGTFLCLHAYYIRLFTTKAETNTVKDRKQNAVMLYNNIPK